MNLTWTLYFWSNFFFLPKIIQRKLKGRGNQVLFYHFQVVEDFGFKIQIKQEVFLSVNKHMDSWTRTKMMK